MRFKAKHMLFKVSEEFTDKNPPLWLIGGRPGSTMDNRWFWEEYVLTLPVGMTVDTEFRRIKRVE